MDIIAAAAVSTFKICLPKLTEIKPFSLAMVTSSLEKPPSGPMQYKKVFCVGKGFIRQRIFNSFLRFFLPEN
jgi:hypothetical protein